MENRRAEDARLGEMHDEIEKIRARVYNGLGAELRKEVADALRGTNSLVVGLLVAMFLALAGIVIQDRLASEQRSLENDKTYAAVMALDKKLDLHLQESNREDARRSGM